MNFIFISTTFYENIELFYNVKCNNTVTKIVHCIKYINIIKLLFLPSNIKILIVMNKMSEFCKYVLSMILIKLSVKPIIFCSNKTCLKRFWSTSAAILFSFKTIFSKNLCTSSQPRKHQINYIYIIKIHTMSFLECINCCKCCIKILCLWIITDTPKDLTLGWRSFLQNWPCCSGLSRSPGHFL